MAFGIENKKFKVVNVVATQDCGFKIDIEKVQNRSPFLLYADERYTAIKPEGATKQITIFRKGNMITVGNKSVPEARKNFEITRKYLLNFKRK